METGNPRLVINRRCGGSMLAHQTSAEEVPGSNPASPTMILMLAGSLCNNVKLRVERGTYPHEAKNI